MPKSENGDYTCINHPDQNLINKTYVSLNQMRYDPATDHVTNVDNVIYVAQIQHCPECGYIEMYNIIPEEDFPRKNTENSEQA